MSERSKVYFEAIGILFSGVYQKILHQLNHNGYAFSIFVFLVISLLGWLFLFNPLLVIVFNILLFIYLKDDLSIFSNIIGQVLIFVFAFIVSIIISLNYDKEIISSTEIVITDPVFEVTSDKNIILQKDKPNIQITYSSKVFAYLKNANCSEIKEVKYYKNHKDFAEIYRDIEYKDYCDGKEIK